MSTADSKFAGHMYATPDYMVFLVTVPGGAGWRAPGPEKFICEGSYGSRKF